MKKLIFILVLVICFSPLSFTYSELTIEEKNFLQEKRVIRVGVDRDFPPFSYSEIIQDKKSIKGFNIDVLKELEKVLRVEFEIVAAPWGDLVLFMDSGDIDAIAGMIYSEERCKKYYFSLPLVVSTRAVFKSRQSNDIISLSSVKDKVVAVQKLDIAEEIVEALGVSEMKKVNDQIEGLYMVNSGVADAFVGNRLVGAYNINKHNLRNIEILSEIINPMDYSFSALKGNETLIRVLNKGIMRLESSGQLARIQNRHFSVFSEYQKMYELLIILIIIFSVILMIFIFFNIALKKQITKKTSEMEALITILSSRNQEIVKMYQELRNAEYSKNNLMKMFGHDLKTPLVSVKGYTDMMKNGNFGNLNIKQTEVVEKIIHSVDKLVIFINNFLGKTKNETEINKTVFNVKQLIEECADFYSYFISENGIKFSFLAEGFLNIYTDKEKVKVIIMNLLDNAFKYCDLGGDIVLKSQINGNDLDIVLTNSCCTPPVDPLRWFKEEPTDLTSDKPRLGLYLIKKLIGQLKGELSAEHKEGKVTVNLRFFNIISI